ncbi:MAG TPA: dihydrodipicolinate synthase family protein [Candidatus Paceibacterota bacterium]|nr:dihydrodipicolinate synthase family protein [Verrucomicrobiota bacterium]HRY46459.1 dihydrodipicolinate synthase family protein [Candidatus Paceibacterota bacterium]HSA03590.1 dihydrodipicolinate synthase family protein [Candidatus Paceibacterota bacterium]
MNDRLKGLIAAPFTAMQPDGSLSLGLIQQQAMRLAEDGVRGAFICGTTGEGLSLTTEERIQVAERWVKVAPKDLKVIVHVAHNSLGESRQLAAHAQQIGAAAIATVGPTFFRPSSVEQLVDFCAATAEAAPGLPFYYYHIPVMTGIHLPMVEFLRLGSTRIPNLAGIKFTDENLMSYMQCLRFEDGRFNILFGRDEILLAALALGATGMVGSTYNYMAPLYHKVIDAFTAGDLDAARRWQMHAIRIIAIMIRHGGLPANKAIMSLIGMDCGPVRPPLRNLTVKEFESLREDLAQLGFPSQWPLAPGDGQ